MTTVTVDVHVHVLTEALQCVVQTDAHALRMRSGGSASLGYVPPPAHLYNGNSDVPQQQGIQGSAFADSTGSVVANQHGGSSSAVRNAGLPPLPPHRHSTSRAGGSTARVSGSGGPVAYQRVPSVDALQTYQGAATVADGQDSTFLPDGWLTTADANVRTTSAPDIKGRLDNALDNLAVSGAPYLGKFVMLSAAHRRAGGQGVVQFARGWHDGEDYAVRPFLVPILA